MRKIKTKTKVKEKVKDKTIFIGIQPIELSQLKPSKNNYRKTFNKKALDELTASIKAKGVLQPITVRRVNGKFEIVSGHRRFQASQDAGLSSIPAMIRELSDEEALEIQIIENSQREDPNPMEEAWGFDKLIKMGKHTPETLALKLDKSIDYVLGRIKLLKLPKDAQEKIISGEISIGHAMLLTRLKHPSEQKEFLKFILEQDASVKLAREELRDFSCKIEQAIFDLTECEKCPFLSRNQSVLFPELKKSGDCMDRGCFLAKTRDHYQAIIDEKKAAGFKIITDEKEIDKLTSYNSKSSKEIDPPDKKKDGYYSSAVRPKRYKSECMKCTEHHAYFICEKESYSGKTIAFGEICLNTKCLDAMQGTIRPEYASGSGNGGSNRDNSFATERNARECRNRFLIKELRPRIAESDVLRKRLLALHLFNKLQDSKEKSRIVNEFGGKYCSHFMQAEEYAYAKVIAPGSLDDAIKEVIIVMVKETDPLALLQMTEEAGIDMMKDFAIDEEFLKTKTKDELILFVQAQTLKIEATPSSKKGRIIEEILKHDLRGKLPPECIEECKIEDPEKNEGDYEQCANCDKPIDTLMDGYSHDLDTDKYFCEECTEKVTA